MVPLNPAIVASRTDYLQRWFISKHTGVALDDVKEVVTTGSTETRAYFVAVDHSTHSVVLSIRGTFSLSDTLVDLLCNTVGRRREQSADALILPSNLNREKTFFLNRRLPTWPCQNSELAGIVFSVPRCVDAINLLFYFQLTRQCSNVSVLVGRLPCAHGHCPICYVGARGPVCAMSSAFALFQSSRIYRSDIVLLNRHEHNCAIDMSTLT